MRSTIRAAERLRSGRHQLRGRPVSMIDGSDLAGVVVAQETVDWAQRLREAGRASGVGQLQ